MTHCSVCYNTLLGVTDTMLAVEDVLPIMAIATLDAKDSLLAEHDALLRLEG